MSLFSRLFRRKPKPRPAQEPGPASPPGERSATAASALLEAPHASSAAASSHVRVVETAPPPTMDAPLRGTGHEARGTRGEEADADEASNDWAAEDGAFEDDTPEEDTAEDEACDPTIGRYEPLEISLPVAEEVQIARGEAERAALSAPQRITPSDPAGPGSLAEALARLEAEGRLVSRVVDDPDEGFAILYEPAPRG